MRHYTSLCFVCEEIANNRKLPGRVTDWADELYDRLIKKEAIVLVEDLQLLQSYGEDSEYAIGLIDIALAMRGL